MGEVINTVFAQCLFLLSAVLAVGGAIMVVVSKNLMHACVFLLAALFGISGLYLTLGADFLAATQLVVYAGGVVILMLFAVMLTGGVKNSVNRFGIKKIPAMGNLGTYIFASLVVLTVVAVLVKIVLRFMSTHQEGNLPEFVSTVDKIGVLLITDHVLAFEISSILLLGALIGAAVIARPRKN